MRSFRSAESGLATDPIHSKRSSAWTSEIIKGTGRFDGIKGTQSVKTKYLPLGKGEVAPKGYGEGTITYTLPPK